MAKNQNLPPNAKVQLTISAADHQRFMELAEVMTITPSQLGAIAIREWLLRNYSTHKEHYS